MLGRRAQGKAVVALDACSPESIDGGKGPYTHCQLVWVLGRGKAMNLIHPNQGTEVQG